MLRIGIISDTHGTLDPVLTRRWRIASISSTPGT